MVVEAREDVELELHREGFGFVIGMDEVGRGAIAGPVVVVAVARRIDSAAAPAGLRDSKLLSINQRERLAPVAASWAHAWALGSASAMEVDAHGIVPALRLAGTRALEQLWDQGLPPRHSVVLLDGTHNWLGGINPAPAAIRVRAKADRDCAVVAAASVIAKVERDREMTLAAAQAPAYGWERNKGYGSAEHLEAVARHGVHPMHRASWIRSTEPTP
ncbi:MAG TPA: ribonuclease HII [Microbacteriaceae bacterium]|nr:ribonuclease HII [Microbacteriaceae bacterium]